MGEDVKVDDYKIHKHRRFLGEKHLYRTTGQKKMTALNILLNFLLKPGT